MENQSKLVRVYTKVTVEQVAVFEEPDQDYKVIGKDATGVDQYGYVDNPNKTKKREEASLLYTQKFDEGDLNVKDLTLWANRIR